MIFVDDEPNCGCANPIPAPINPVKERLDSMQTSIDELNAEVSNLTGSVNNAIIQTSNLYNVAKHYTNQSVLTSREAIAADIATSVNTSQLLAANVNADNIAAGTEITTPSLTTGDAVISNNLIVPEADITSADITTVNITTADISTANIDVLHATSADFQNLNINSLDVSSFGANSAEIDEITSSIGKINKIVAELITTDTEDYNHAMGVDNTHLFKLSVPFYDGVINIVEEQDDFNITIIDNSIVSYTQNPEKNYLKKIYIGTDTIDFYFANIYDDFWYKIINIGSTDTVTPLAENVLRTGVTFNIVRNHGVYIYKLADALEEAALKYLIVDELPETGIENIIYIVDDDNSYIWDDETEAFISLVNAAKFVPITRKINNYPLSSDITLKTSDLPNDADFATNTEVATAITNAVNALDVASAGGDTKYISAISETNGKISATVKDVAQTYSSTGTTAASGTAIAAAIGTLDVASVGGAGKYISAISETDGKISATEANLADNVVTGVKGNSETDYRVGQVNITKSNIGLGSVVNTGDSATPVSGGTTKFTTGGAYTELAKKVDTTRTINGKALSSDISLTASDVGAATSGDITTAINALDVTSVGGSGKYIESISETNGKISATAGTFSAPSAGINWATVLS